MKTFAKKEGELQRRPAFWFERKSSSNFKFICFREIYFKEKFPKDSSEPLSDSIKLNKIASNLLSDVSPTSGFHIHRRRQSIQNHRIV